jgi:porin
VVGSGFIMIETKALGAAPSPDGSTTDSTLSKWWNGKHMSGNWFGLRDAIEDKGLTISGKYYGAYFGVVDSQGGSRGFWDQGIEFGGEQNFGKLFGNSNLNGLKAFANFRYRSSESSSNPNTFVQASSMFNPSNWVSGEQFRVSNFGFEIGSANLLPVEDMIVLRGGWLQPQKEFLDQPLSKLFLNNAMNSSKGEGGNIPFSSSASTWGGTLKVKPIEWHYAKAGLFMSYPEMTATSNHGIAFQGFAQDPSQNGLWVMAETGITPEIGPSKLPGHYAAGGYYYGGNANSFNGTSHYGQFGFYWQADQMLYREPLPEEPAPAGKGASDGKSYVGAKSFKAPVDTSTPELGQQGLSMFSMVSFAPKYNNLYPFFFQAGLVYRGLIPHRDDDQVMFGLAYGSYSYYNLLEQRENGDPTATYTMFLEWGYRIQVNGWSFVQPFAQYAIRPNGTDDVKNATILGVYVGANF